MFVKMESGIYFQHAQLLCMCTYLRITIIIILGYFDFTYNVQPDPTQTNHWQTIGDYQHPESAGPESTVKGYDQKYNIGEAEEFEPQTV